MGHNVRKLVFGGLGTTQVQTSLRICAVWSAPLLFAVCLKLTLSETQKTGFLMTRPISNLIFAQVSLFQLIYVAQQTGSSPTW